MDRKKKFRGKTEPSHRLNHKYSFLFYSPEFNEEDIKVIRESIKRIKKEHVEASDFYLYQQKPNYAPSSDVEISGLKIIQKDNPIKEISADNPDYLFLIRADNIVNFNINDLLRDDISLPPANALSSLYFLNQGIEPATSLLIGGELLKYLADVPFLKESGIMTNISWYVNRLNIRERKIFLQQNYPYSEKAKHQKPVNPVSLFNRWFEWNITEPFKLWKENKRTVEKESPLLRPLFIFLSLAILFALPILSINSGISGDEEKHHLHAEKVYNYFKSDGMDTLALSDSKYKLNYYGQSFDLFSYVFIKTFNIEKVYETRHVLNGIAGAAAIITTALLVKMLAGSFGGIICLLLLFFSPRFLGHAMNNPLDIPFALGYIFTILQLIRFLKRLPEFSVRIAILISLGTAFTISIRIGGLILIPYIFLFSGLYLILNSWPWKFMSKKYLSFVGKGILYLSVISIASYFLSILVWPYALRAPLKNPFVALDMMSNISVALRVMFEGKIIWSDKLPWYYIPKNILLSVPFFILFMFILPMFGFLRKKTEIKPFWIFLLYFTVIFPVLFIIYKESNVYGGWRHTLFIYPSMVALSAIAISRIYLALKPGYARKGLSVVVLIAMIHPVLHIFKNYPLQYIYFNEISGGVNKVYKKYETDYYMHSLKPGTDWIISNIISKEKEEENSKIKILSNAPYEIMNYYFREYRDFVDIPYGRYYDRGMYDWDYAIFFCNYIDPFQLKKNIWPPKNTIHKIKVDDVTVCAIVKRENRDDYRGYSLMNKGSKERDISIMSESISLLVNAIRYDKHNEVAYLNLAQAYLIVEQFDLARNTLNSLLEIYPEYDKALNLIGYTYLSEGDIKRDKLLIDKSIAYFNHVIQVNYKFTPAYHNMGLAFMIIGDDETALAWFDKALEINARYKQSYYMIANIIEKRGDQQRADEIRQYANSI